MPENLYDPKKNYHWDEEETFCMRGIEFASFFHLLMREMNDPTGANMAIKVEAYGVMLKVFNQGIADGKIVQSTEPIPKALKATDDPLVNNLFK